MPTIMEKDEAHRLIDRMPQGATWDDLMKEIYVRETIKRGLADSNAGRTRDVKEIRSKYGLPKCRFIIKPDQIDILALIHGAMDVLHH